MIGEAVGRALRVVGGVVVLAVASGILAQVTTLLFFWLIPIPQTARSMGIAFVVVSLVFFLVGLVRWLRWKSPVRGRRAPDRGGADGRHQQASSQEANGLQTWVGLTWTRIRPDQ